MSTVLIVGLAIAVLVCIVFTGVSVMAARQLVAAPAPKQLAFELHQSDAVRFPVTPQTVLPGEYGLIYDNGRGHARIGSVIDGGAEQGFVIRAFSSVTGTAIPRQGEGAFVRDVYRTPAALGLPFENVDIVSDAGTSPAWVVTPGSGSYSTVWAIHLHGIRTTRSVVLPGVLALSGLGITSLVVSWRGDTEGPQTANGTSFLGQEEWRDVEAAIAFVMSSGAESIIFIGWSMGATIARLLMERSRFRDRVAGMVLISPVTSWRAVIKRAIRAARLPAAVAWGVEVALGNRVLSRFAGLSTPVSLGALESVSTNHTRPVPTLVIHNPGDDLVPFSTVAAYVARNSKHTELVVFEESPHAMEWNVEPKKFEETLRTWASALLHDRSRQLGNE
ncbi:alpha/beta fold hydrolase [Salinibacterium sp. G-O1]|uniref:alpha/beta hydrolase family protein n=1 Tax=Salinibacterium sp. G-O1 TaxID=3046208 RepID=UPI0024B99FC8|nr:alpha/beta fold hydrolase [Salinibacterium sp. G-O1]MDJ0336604.1 alpha/beta fold hydrolase [Salinibacterium sp. G-O1]